MKVGCLLLVGLLAVGTVVPLVLSLGHEPANEAERRYIRNAQEARGFINSNPIAGMLTILLVRRTVVADLRPVPRSCDSGTDDTIRHMSDVVATVTDYSFWAIPIERYETTCAGLSITRGRFRTPPAEAPSGMTPPAPSSSPPPPPPPAA